MLGIALGFAPMLMLGSFSFSTNTAAYQNLTRRAQFGWPTQPRYGGAPAAQFVGRELEVIELDGWIPTTFRAGHNQIQRLRDLANLGTPHLLIDGVGRILGAWSILGIEETTSNFAAFGLGQRQDFRISLQEYADDLPTI